MDFSSFGELPSLSTLWKFTPLDTGCRRHLNRVYALLLAGVLSSALAVWLHLNVTRVVEDTLGPLALSIIAIGCLILLQFSGDKASVEGYQLGLYFGFTVSKG
jgi:hypothetical protein